MASAMQIRPIRIVLLRPAHRLRALLVLGLSFLAAVSAGGTASAQEQTMAGLPNQDLQTACGKGVAEACGYLGLRYFLGQNGTPRNLEQGVIFFRKGCDGGDIESCNQIGLSYANGEGVAQDKGAAAGFYSSACNGGNANGCANLGALYDRGEGVERDKVRAATLYAKACDGGSASGCFLLGVAYYKGESVAKDVARAAQYWRLACDGGIESACKNLKAIGQ